MLTERLVEAFLQPIHDFLSLAFCMRWGRKTFVVGDIVVLVATQQLQSLHSQILVFAIEKNLSVLLMFAVYLQICLYC